MYEETREGNLHYVGSVRITSGTGAFSSVTPSNKKINARPGAKLVGKIQLETDNRMAAFAVAPLIGVPLWGNRRFNWWIVDSWIKPGKATYTANVELDAPPVPGVYPIVFVFRGETRANFVASATNWTLKVPHWDDGNDVAEFDPAKVKEAQEKGYVVHNWLMPEGPTPSIVPADAIEVIVQAEIAGPSEQVA